LVGPGVDAVVAYDSIAAAAAAATDARARRTFWAEQMDGANAFMREAMDYPVAECGERMVSLEAAIAAAGDVEVIFSKLPHANGTPRIHFLRKGLVPHFLGVAREMNERGWVLKVEDAYRTTDMQAALGRRDDLFATILRKVVWELGDDERAANRAEIAKLLIRRVGALIAAAPKVGTHMSGSAIDVSVIHRDSREEVDRGAPYLELSELTPMESPFVSAAQRENRRAITAIFASHSFVTYPWEFWHYNAGDAYEKLLSDKDGVRVSSAHARYGAVNLDPKTGAVSELPDVLRALNSDEEMRALMDGALAAGGGVASGGAADSTGAGSNVHGGGSDDGNANSDNVDTFDTDMLTFPTVQRLEANFEAINTEFAEFLSKTPAAFRDMPNTDANLVSGLQTNAWQEVKLYTEAFRAYREPERRWKHESCVKLPTLCKILRDDPAVVGRIDPETVQRINAEGGWRPAHDGSTTSTSTSTTGSGAGSFNVTNACKWFRKETGCLEGRGIMLPEEVLGHDGGRVPHGEVAILRLAPGTKLEPHIGFANTRYVASPQY
jgi:D-alanyl-D-alanine dipeptidase